MNKSLLSKKKLMLVPLFVSAFLCVAEPSDIINTDSKLLDEYIKTKEATIVFDANNIKQFWTDNSVVSKDGAINIKMTSSNNGLFRSIPLTIQLANVNETMDCKIYIITDNPNMAFDINSNKSKVVPSTTARERFLQYHILSSCFHMEDTLDDAFNLTFSSESQEVVAIKKVLLSFSLNKSSHFLCSPCKLNNIERDFDIKGELYNVSNNTISIMGNEGEISGKKYIISSDKEVSFSAKIINKGNIPVQVRVGFQTFNKNRKDVRGNYFPLNNATNEVLNVLSVENKGKVIVIDKDFMWNKNNWIVSGAKEDYSDIPNYSLICKIDNVERRENGQVAIITLTPVDDSVVTPGMKLRVHGNVGGIHYLKNKKLLPGDELVIDSSIKQDESCVQYGGKVFPKGVYSFKPIILFSSEKDDGNILISDLSISY